MTGIYLHDFNCGLKAYKNEVVKAVEVYGEMHRYIQFWQREQVMLLLGKKLCSTSHAIMEPPNLVLERFINGPLDLLSITFVSKFGQRANAFIWLFWYANVHIWIHDCLIPWFGKTLSFESGSSSWIGNR